MRDPRLMDVVLGSPAFYERNTLMPEFYRQEPRPPDGWPDRDSREALVKADNQAHDNVKMLVRVNDVLRRDQWKLMKKLETERKWRLGIFSGLLISIFLMLLEIILKK